VRHTSKIFSSLSPDRVIRASRAIAAIKSYGSGCAGRSDGPRTRSIRPPAEAADEFPRFCCATAVAMPNPDADPVLVRPEKVGFGSFAAVQAAQRHGRSTSLSGPAEPERADLAIRHRRGAIALDALGSISGPAAKRTSYRRTVRCRLSNSMLRSGPTTPQDYRERSGFGRRREREWGHGGTAAG
jgi:hypothetical protein